MKTITRFLLALSLVLTIGACVAETAPEPEGESAETATPIAPGKMLPIEIDENAVNVPSLPPGFGVPTVHLGINPVGGSCVAAIGAYCPTANIYAWPLTGTFKCYCVCDANKQSTSGNVHPDCVNMPTAKQCGTLFDVYVPDPNGGPGTFSYTFPNGGSGPYACQQVGSSLASTVP